MIHIALSALPTEEELHKVRDCLLLPLLIEIVNKNRSQLEYDQIALKALFLRATDILLERIIADHVKIKKDLKSAGIKLIEKPDTRMTLNCEFICRGYHEKFSIMKDHAKAVLSVMLGKFVQKTTFATFLQCRYCNTFYNCRGINDMNRIRRFIISMVIAWTIWRRKIVLI